MAQRLKRLPAMQEAWVRSLGREVPLEKEMALQYSCLENPKDGGAWWAPVHGVAKSRTRLSELTSLHYPQENSGPERTTGKQVQACCVSRNCRKVSVIE